VKNKNGNLLQCIIRILPFFSVKVDKSFRPETLKVEKHLKKTMQLYYRHF
jgi:hypothetical protein